MNNNNNNDNNDNNNNGNNSRKSGAYACVLFGEDEQFG